MGSQSSRLANGQESILQNSGIMHNQQMNQSGNSITCMTDSQQRGNFINTVFQWKYGANSVQLTGTFNNWVNPIPLKKMENNCFEIILKLSPGIYKYKYIVDGEWRFSPQDPTCNDENENINNIIDTTNIERTTFFIGQNTDSARFLMIGSQNSSANFTQTNTRAINSNGNTNQQQQSQQTNTFNQQNAQGQLGQLNPQNQYNQQNAIGMNNNNNNNNRGLVDPQLQLTIPQQQFYAQLQQQQQQQQQQLQQQQQPIQQQLIQPQLQEQNQDQYFIASQNQAITMNQQKIQMFQQLTNNDNNNNQQAINLNQLQQQYGGGINRNEANQQLYQQQQQQQGSKIYYGQHNMGGMQGMYLRGSHQSNVFDRSQLLVKAHIAQQNQTNMDIAFKEKAPQMPPHLLEVPTIKRHNAQQVFLWREKQIRPKTALKHHNRTNLEDKSAMTDESSNQSEGNHHDHHHFGNGEEYSYQNTSQEDTEVLMHIFQPGHSISPVDHVILNHVGIDNLAHNDRYNVHCITQRFKTKYTTYKFYNSKYDTQIII